MGPVATGHPTLAFHLQTEEFRPYLEHKVGLFGSQVQRQRINPRTNQFFTPKLGKKMDTHAYNNNSPLKL